ncbi:MAG: DUF2231 domain-containing protein, partial [Acidimicrobiia bacterium]
MANHTSYPQSRGRAETAYRGVQSTTHILGHPVHPMLIPFPIGFLTGVAATDIAYVLAEDEFWARASLWLVATGFITGAVAAVVGLIDFLTIE